MRIKISGLLAGVCYALMASAVIAGVALLCIRVARTHWDIQCQRNLDIVSGEFAARLLSEEQFRREAFGAVSRKENPLLLLATRYGLSPDHLVWPGKNGKEVTSECAYETWAWDAHMIRYLVDNGDIPIVWENRPAHHGDKRMVATNLGATVTLMKEEDFQARMREVRKELSGM